MKQNRTKTPHISLKNLPEKIQDHELLAKGVMDITWTGNTRESSAQERGGPYVIGTLHHSKKLSTVVATGELDGFLAELCQLYRDIYAGEPWKEYLICVDPDCQKTLGKEDIFGSDDCQRLNVLEQERKNIGEQTACPDCAGRMEFFYPEEDFLGELQRAFQQKIIAAFLLNGEAKLCGFALGWETTVAAGWQDKFLQGHGDRLHGETMSYELYLQEIRRNIHRALHEQDPVFNSAEWAIAPAARSVGASLQLIRAKYAKALQLMQKNSPVPVIGHSLQGSKALSIFRRFGFSSGQVQTDGTVRVYSTLERLLEGIDAF